jgi:hypothetical protein
VEIPFEVIDVDGESHVGQITAIDKELIRIDTGSGDLTFSPRRVEIVQNLSPNPFLLPNKPTKDNDPQTSITSNRQFRTEIINGQMVVISERGNIVPLPNLAQARKRVLPPAFLEKLREAENEKNTDKQNTQKLPQFPPSVIVIELLDGSRLIATQFIVKEQKVICNLLDQNYTAPQKNVDKKDNTETAKEKPNEKNNTPTGNEVMSEVVIPFEQVYSVRFAVKNFSDIFEPSAEWLKYIGNTGTSGDRIVINKAGAFDVYSGIVSEVTRDVVVFSIDNEKLPIQRSKIYGIILHSPNREQIKRKTVSGGQITFWTGTQLMLESFTLKKSETKQVAGNIRNDNSDVANTNNKISEVDVDIDDIGKLSGSKILWKALAGFSGEIFLSEVDNIIFSRGNSLYLTDLVPIIRERLLPFEWSGSSMKTDNSTPISKIKLFQASTLGIGKNNIEKLDPSLELVTPQTSQRNSKQIINQPIPAIEGVILDGVSYRRCVVLSPKTVLEYAVTDLEQSYSAIRGFVGVDDRLKPNGRAKLIVAVDGKVICTMEIRGKDTAKLLRYELPQTHKKITITADFTDNITESVPISIGDLKLIK